MNQAITVKSPEGDHVDCIDRYEAARRLGISIRTLHDRTYPRGSIMPVRWGRRVLYSIAELDRYLVEQMQPSNGKGGKR